MLSPSPPASFIVCPPPLTIIGDGKNKQLCEEQGHFKHQLIYFKCSFPVSEHEIENWESERITLLANFFFLSVLELCIPTLITIACI